MSISSSDTCKEKITIEHVLKNDLPTMEELTGEAYNDMRELLIATARENFLLKSKLFKCSSERMKPELNDIELLPGVFDGIEPIDSTPEATAPGKENGEVSNRSKRKRKGGGRLKVPESFPREVTHIYPDGLTEEMINEDPNLVELEPEISEQVAIIPPQIYVKQVIRHKVVCLNEVQKKVSIAPVPPKFIKKGLFDVSFLAHLVVEKFAYHQPLGRIQTRFKRMGIKLARSSLSDQVQMIAERLTFLYDYFMEELLGSKVIYMDDTGVRLLLQEGGSSKSNIWVYAGHPCTHPYVVFKFSENRKKVHPQNHLEGYHGHLSCDAYSGYDQFFNGETCSTTELACWSHTRRYFYDAYLLGEPNAWIVLEFIGQLFLVEKQAKLNGYTGEKRKAFRMKFVPGILSDIREWLDTTGIRVLPKSKMGEAVTYINNQWDALQTYLTDGDFEMNNNYAERLLRIIAIGRKNWMFFGAESGGVAAAKLFSIVQTCIINEVDPWLYLTDIMNRLAQGPIDPAPFVPHRWKANYEAQAKQSHLPSTK